MVQPQNVVCPICLHKVAHYDGKGTINITATCFNCNKQILFNVNTGLTDYRNRPPKNTSSGARFC